MTDIVAPAVSYALVMKFTSSGFTALLEPRKPADCQSKKDLTQFCRSQLPPRISLVTFIGFVGSG